MFFLLLIGGFIYLFIKAEKTSEKIGAVILIIVLIIIMSAMSSIGDGGVPMKLDRY